MRKKSNKAVTANEIWQAVDSVLLLMMKHGLITQDPQDPDNFIHTDVSEETYFAKMELISKECAVMANQHQTVN